MTTIRAVVGAVFVLGAMALLVTLPRAASGQDPYGPPAPGSLRIDGTPTVGETVTLVAAGFDSNSAVVAFFRDPSDTNTVFQQAGTADGSGVARVQVALVGPIVAGDYRVTVSGFTPDSAIQNPSDLLTVAAAPPDVPNQLGVTCAGRSATVVGTSGDDTLVGTSGVDIIAGLGGNDTITGLAGADVICGGTGDDVIAGGGGADVIYGDRGRDTLRGNGGPDQIFGGAGRDRIWGGRNGDRLFGGPGQDRIRGNGGADKIWGGKKPDVIWGGSGRDNLRGNGGGDELRGGPGSDRCRGGMGANLEFSCER